MLLNAIKCYTSAFKLLNQRCGCTKWQPGACQAHPIIKLSTHAAAQRLRFGYIHAGQTKESKSYFGAEPATKANKLGE